MTADIDMDAVGQPQAPLRWGILGTGGIADMMARDLLLDDARGDHVITAVGSRSQAGADRFLAKHGLDRPATADTATTPADIAHADTAPAHAHASYEALVADDDVDIVYVATPHPFHHANALLALDAGKHVLVEKPFTMNAEQARDIVARATEVGRFAMEAMWTRFLPHMARVREWLAQGALGDLVGITADHGQWFAHDPGFRLFAPELGGGALLDLGVYPVSFASMVAGGPPERMATLVDPAFNGVVDGQTSMLFGYARGVQAHLTCTSAAKSATRASIVGTDARIEIDPTWYAPTTITLVPREGEPTTERPPARGRGMIYQADHARACIAAGQLESDLLPLAETVQIMTTMDAVLAASGLVDPTVDTSGR